MSKFDMPGLDSINVGPKKGTKLTDVVAFGKHKGETLKDIIDTDPRWVYWALDKVDKFDIDEEAEEYLNGDD